MTAITTAEAHAACETSDCFSAAALGMSPARPTRIDGSKLFLELAESEGRGLFARLGVPACGRLVRVFVVVEALDETALYGDLPVESIVGRLEIPGARVEPLVGLGERVRLLG